MSFPKEWLRWSSAMMMRGGGCVAILLGAYAAYDVGYQAYARAHKSEVTWQTAQGYNAKSWRRIMPMKTLELNEKAEVGKQLIVFSPVDFQLKGARLVSWIPSASGGDMSLETPWQQVPATFSRLAERGMQVIAFSLSAENGVLRLGLQLGRDDAP